MLTLLLEVAEEVINPRFRTLEDDQIAEKNPGDLVPWPTARPRR